MRDIIQTEHGLWVVCCFCKQLDAPQQCEGSLSEEYVQSPFRGLAEALSVAET